MKAQDTLVCFTVEGNDLRLSIKLEGRVLDLKATFLGKHYVASLKPDTIDITRVVAEITAKRVQFSRGSSQILLSVFGDLLVFPLHESTASCDPVEELTLEVRHLTKLVSHLEAQISFLGSLSCAISSGYGFTTAPLCLTQQCGKCGERSQNLMHFISPRPDKFVCASCGAEDKLQVLPSVISSVDCSRCGRTSAGLGCRAGGAGWVATPPGTVAGYMCTGCGMVESEARILGTKLQCVYCSQQFSPTNRLGCKGHHQPCGLRYACNPTSSFRAGIMNGVPQYPVASPDNCFCRATKCSPQKFWPCCNQPFEQKECPSSQQYGSQHSQSW